MCFAFSCLQKAQKDGLFDVGGTNKKVASVLLNGKWWRGYRKKRFAQKFSHRNFRPAVSYFRQFFFFFCSIAIRKNVFKKGYEEVDWEQVHSAWRSIGNWFECKSSRLLFHLLAQCEKKLKLGYVRKKIGQWKRRLAEELLKLSLTIRHIDRIRMSSFIFDPNVIWIRSLFRDDKGLLDEGEHEVERKLNSSQT